MPGSSEELEFSPAPHWPPHTLDSLGIPLLQFLNTDNEEPDITAQREALKQEIAGYTSQVSSRRVARTGKGKWNIDDDKLVEGHNALVEISSKERKGTLGSIEDYQTVVTLYKAALKLDEPKTEAV